MKITTKIILIAMVIAFGMQSTAMAEWKFKSPGEIAKNLGKKAVKNEKVQDAAKEKLKGEGEDKDNTEATDEKADEKDSAEE